MFVQYIAAVLLIAQACVAKPRITDGHDAQPHQYPYQVSLEWGAPPLVKFRHMCGGSIINENWILTAGHCVTEAPKLGSVRVVAGKHKLLVEEGTEQTVEVIKKVVHSNYAGGVGPNDIALFQLKTPLVFNQYVQAVALPKQGTQHTGTAVLTGWGSVSKQVLPVLPATLQTVDVPIVGQAECKKAIESVSALGRKSDSNIYETQVCTGPLGGSISACSGDSGGPLVKFVNGKPEQIGVVSWGLYPCGTAGAPSVYTRVSSFVNWINSVIN